MRIFLPNLIAVALTAAGGWATCSVVSMNPHWREMTLAAVVCLIASELAVVPILLTRKATQAAVSQAGLAATVIHLFATVILGAGLNAVGHPDKTFLYWLLAFYWMTLIAVSFVSIRAIRTAPIAAPATPTNAK